jgi:tetratricopeptide (TPR) repeat protein
MAGFSPAQKTTSAEDYYKRGLGKIKPAETAATFEVSENKYKEASEDFSKAIELNPREAKFYLKRGECFDALFEPEKAIEDFSKAIELKPDFVEAYIERAKVHATYFEEDGQLAKSAETALLDSAKAEKALADFNKAVEINPKNADAYIARANYFFRPLNDYKAALNDLNKAVEVEPRLADAFIERAVFYFHQMEDNSKALADCTTAIKLNPQNADGYELRAEIYSEIGEYQKAITDYTTALRLNPNNPAVLFNRATAYYQIGKTRLAEADERKAEKLNKTAPIESRIFTIAADEIKLPVKESLTEEELAVSYIELSKKDLELIPKDAEGNKIEIERLTNILQADPQSIFGLFERGRAYARLAEYDKAIADFSKVIGLDPNDFYAFNNRGIACAKSGNYERAIADFARASTINPKEYSILYNFGLVLFNKGSFNLSINILTGYIEKEPNDFKSYQLRAKAYRKIGKITEAEADEKKSKSLN